MDNTMPRQPLPVILDTDIGTDVDDALALALILGSPELKLIAATTAYGDVRLRARLTKRIARLAGRDLLAVPGEAATLAHRPVYWAGHEGSNHFNLGRERADHQIPATDLIAQIADHHPGQLNILAIAPLTNIARAFTIHSGLRGKLGHLWIMGGDWQPGSKVEHNFQADPEAASIVMNSGCPITIIGLDITKMISLDQNHIATLDTCGPLGTTLAADIRQCLSMWRTDVDHPHDAVAALALVDNQIFTFSSLGRVRISTGRQPGRAVFSPDPAGTIRIATTVDSLRATQQIMERIQTACRRPLH